MKRPSLWIVTLATLFTAVAEAQTLFRVDAPANNSLRSVASAAVEGDLASPMSIPIRLDTSLLATAPAKLVLPDLGEGATFLQLIHFEDRGDSNVMWSGGYEGTFLETSVLTVRDGFTAGTLVDSAGTRWSLRADSAGIGSFSKTGAGPSFDWCLAEVVDEEEEEEYAGSSSASLASDLPVAMRESSSANGTAEIDVLFVSSPRARWFWKNFPCTDRYGTVPGCTPAPRSPNLEVQSYIDFGNMVLRNSGVDAVLKAVPVDAHDNLVEHSPVPNLDFSMNVLAHALDRFEALQALRTEYKADLVYIVAYSYFAEMMKHCGTAMIMGKNFTPRNMARYAYGYTDLNCDKQWPGHAALTFIHEVGHNLGGQHNREIPHMEWKGKSRWKGAYAPYSYGFLRNPGTPYDDPLKKRRNDDRPGSAGAAGSYSPGAVATIMSYKPSGDGWVRVPYFSTPGVDLQRGYLGLDRHEPLDGSDKTAERGWRLGKVGYANNAKVLRETTKILARTSDHLFRYSHMPGKPEVEARDNADGTITLHVRWLDQSRDEIAFLLRGEKYKGDVGQMALTPLGKFVRKKRLPSSRTGWKETTGIREAKWSFSHTRRVLGIDVLSVNYDGRTTSGTVFVGPVIRPSPPALSVDYSDVEEFGQAYVVIDMDASDRIESVQVVEETRPVGTSEWETVPEEWKSPSNVFTPGSSNYAYTVFVGSGHEFRVTVTTENAYGAADAVSAEFTVQ